MKNVLGLDVSSEMLPISSVKDCLHRGSGNAEHLRNFILRYFPCFAEMSNLPYLIFGKFCLRVIATAAGNFASFGSHIVHVAGLRSKKQVIWIDALPNIASVADKQTAMDFPVRQYPRHSVSLDNLVPNGELTAPGTLDGTDPFPAVIRAPFVYLFPEAIFKAFRVEVWKLGRALAAASGSFWKNLFGKRESLDFLPANSACSDVVVSHNASGAKVFSCIDIIPQVAR